MKDTTKKDTSILIRLTTDEKEAIRKAAVKDKVTVSEYIRGKLFEAKQDTKQDTFDISHTVSHIETLKSQVEYLQGQNQFLQDQNKHLQERNKVYQNEQLDLLQRLLLLSTQQAEKIELIEHEETKKSFFQKFFNR